MFVLLLGVLLRKFCNYNVYNQTLMQFLHVLFLEKIVVLKKKDSLSGANRDHALV